MGPSITERKSVWWNIFEQRQCLFFRWKFCLAIVYRICMHTDDQIYKTRSLIVNEVPVKKELFLVHLHLLNLVFYSRNYFKTCVLQLNEYEKTPLNMLFIIMLNMWFGINKSFNNSSKFFSLFFFYKHIWLCMCLSFSPLTQQWPDETSKENRYVI